MQHPEVLKWKYKRIAAIPDLYYGMHILYNLHLPALNEQAIFGTSLLTPFVATICIIIS